MKLRIIKRANGVFQVEWFRDTRWVFVSQSTCLTVEEAEKKLTEIIAHGEPHDVVIKEVEV